MVHHYRNQSHTHFFSVQSSQDIEQLSQKIDSTFIKSGNAISLNAQIVTHNWKFLSANFRHLFTPISLGPITLKNRIYVTPHATMFASDDRDNLPGETLAYYCAERAKGGAALVEVSLAMVTPGGGNTSTDIDGQFDPLCVGHPMALSGRWPLRGFDPKIVEGYSKLAKAVHAHGGKCFIEIQSVGTNQANFSGVSRFPWPTHPIHTMPFTSRELDKSEIESEIEAYRQSSKAREGWKPRRR